MRKINPTIIIYITEQIFERPVKKKIFLETAPFRHWKRKRNWKSVLTKTVDLHHKAGRTALEFGNPKTINDIYIR